MDVGDYISLGALAVSGIALWVSVRSNRRAQVHAERISDLAAAQKTEIQLQRAERGKADLRLYVLEEGKSQYYLNIRNEGRGTAKNLQIHSMQKPSMLVAEELEEKVNGARLRPGEVLRVFVFISDDTPEKETILIKWDDQYSAGREDLVSIVI